MEATKALVRDAVAAGILNDLGSGSIVNLVVLTNKGHEYIQGYDKTCEKGVRSGTYDFPKGTTPVLETKVSAWNIS